MNIKYGDLERLFEDIKEIIRFFDDNKYHNRRQKIYLGNGEKINFCIPKEQVAHLIGVNTDYLITTGRYNSKRSYELLKEMCENPYTVESMRSAGHINYAKLFSPFIFNKVSSFKNNINMDLNSIELVCKYDSSKTYTSSDTFEKCDYIIIKKYDDGKIGLLSIVYNGSYYVPMSNQIYDDFMSAKDSLEKFLKHQEITLATGIEYYNEETDFNKPYNLYINAKVDKIENLKKYRNLFNCSIDVSGDYEYLLSKFKNNKSTYLNDNSLMDMIIESIKQGKLIDTSLVKDSNLQKVIQCFNDYLCDKEASNDESVISSYTEMKENLEQAKKECEKLQSENTRLLDENSTLSSEVTKLESENSEYQEREQKVLEILKSPRN